MTRALLVMDQDVLDVSLLEISSKSGSTAPARIAEDVLRALISERVDDYRGAGRPIRIVALVGEFGLLAYFKLAVACGFYRFDLRK